MNSIGHTYAPVAQKNTQQSDVNSKDDKVFKRRTESQNKAMHKYFEEVADELNKAGIEPAIFLQNFRISHTKESVKDIFRQIGRQKFRKDSTSLLTTGEMNEIIKEFDRHLGGFGILMDFPSAELENLKQTYGLDTKK
jgi:hypothetical protein